MFVLVIKREKKKEQTHKDKNQISAFRLLLATLTDAVSVLEPCLGRGEFWVAKSICAEASGARIGWLISSLLSVFF